MSPSEPSREARRRGGLQRGIIILPSAFTLGNLFFGIYSMVAASRGDFQWAAWCIVFAALLDMLDGRIARFTATGSRFGAELDSLVDAVSFGVAPAFLAYHLFFVEGPWSWVVVFIYVTAVVVRLARFNVEQSGEAKKAFHGLPSPTAGMLVATVYPFFTAGGVAPLTGGLPSAQAMGIGLVTLALLMLSHIPYPVVPRISFGTARGALGSGALIGCAVAAIVVPEYFIFPFLATYTAWGMSRAVALGLLERLPEQDPLLDDPDPDDDGGAEIRTLDYGELAPGRYRPSRQKQDDSES
jgi:CDP-diacylglycerol---serine O-phosphatidyltransferase